MIDQKKKTKQKSCVFFLFILLFLFFQQKRFLSPYIGRYRKIERNKVCMHVDKYGMHACMYAWLCISNHRNCKKY